MKKLFASCALAMLVACSTTAQSTVYDLENAYGVLQTTAVAYTKLPYCPQATLCKEPAVVVKLAAYDKNARAALSALEAYVRNPTSYPTASYSSLLAAAQSAVTALQTFETTASIK